MFKPKLCNGLCFASAATCWPATSPSRLADIHGQSAVVRSLSAFAAAPHSNAFIFAGSSGVGKTAAAWALANELGSDPDWGGVVEIPSGTQDGRAVEDLLRRIRPNWGDLRA